MQILVKTITLDTEASDTIEAVKQKIQDKESTINLVLRLRGGNDEKLDSIILSSFRTHKLSSSQVISHYTDIPDYQVKDSIGRLIKSRKIYQSVGGLPKRYSAFSERKAKPIEELEY